MCEHAWSSMDHHPKSWSSLSLQPASYSKGRSRADISAAQWENSLFSSSFSEIFSRKLRFSGNDIHSHQPAKTITSSNGEEEPFESLEELEAKTIGNLLPPEDNMFSGVTTELGHDAQNNNLDDLEDFDLFSSGGGMELEGEGGQGNSGLLGGVPNGQGDSNGSTVVGHPSRTLFVRNINSNVEDSELKAIFEQFGDIRTLYTACKHRGFVMVSYYDIRAARNAMNALQNKPLRCRKLDIHYSIPKDNPSEKDMNQGTIVVFNLDSSISIDELHQIFGVYGEIKEIRESPQRHNDKFIEYYDIRDADAALSALNRSDIAGKQIKVESSLPGGTRRYTSKMLLAAIDDQCRGTYDFIYLPIDFKNKCNVGYAFINMIDPQQIIPFHKAFNGKKWEKFNSEKVASLAYARIQGKAALIAHFQNSSLMNEDKRCRPILFHTDGPNAGDPEPFPMGTHIRSRLGKPQSTGNEENHHSGSPSTLANEEDSPNGIHSPAGSDYVVFFGQDTNSNPVRV
uniref:RRM domain-containing protein n=1 Tax=Populus trichocarpa TaxID=3694 RepID=A0A2K1YBY7_POPTR